jgi:internalin A
MTRLQRLHLYESTRIADGDLTPLLTLTGLRDLRIMSRSHYRPTVADVRTQRAI